MEQQYCDMYEDCVKYEFERETNNLLEIFKHVSDNGTTYYGYLDPKTPYNPVIVADFVDKETYGKTKVQQDKALEKLIQEPIKPTKEWALANGEEKENVPPSTFWPNPVMEIFSFVGSLLLFKGNAHFPEVIKEYLALHTLEQTLDDKGFYKSSALKSYHLEVCMSTNNICLMPDGIQREAWKAIANQQETFFVFLCNAENFNRCIRNIRDVTGNSILKNLVIITTTATTQLASDFIEPLETVKELARRMIDIKNDMAHNGDVVDEALKDTLTVLYLSNKPHFKSIKRKIEHFPFYYETETSELIPEQGYDLRVCKRIVFNDFVSLYKIYGRSCISFADIYVAYEKFLIELDQIIDFIN